MSKLTQKDVSGPGIEWPTDTIEDSADQASFRLLVCYTPITDSMVLRLDVKVDDLQHCRSLPVQLWQPKPGTRILATDPLIEPTKGMDRAAAMLVDRLKLASALHDLASKLEHMR